MDDLDQQIVEELTRDARKPFITIAKKLHISTQTIARRYNELKTNGTITLNAITVNLQKIGYQGTAYLLINTKPETGSAQTVRQLRKTPNIIIATRTIGAYEASAVLAFKNVNDLYEDVSKIKSYPDVLNVEVSFAIPGIKNFPPKTGSN